MTQEKVACLLDNDAHLALDPLNQYKIQVICFNTFLSILFYYFSAEFWILKLKSGRSSFNVFKSLRGYLTAAMVPRDSSAHSLKQLVDLHLFYLDYRILYF